MSDNERIASEEMKAKYSQVTPRDFVEYLNEKGRDGQNTLCGYCGIGEIGVFPSPDGKMAAMVSAPIPDGSGLAVWSYIAACGNCGNLLFFAATKVVNHVLEKK